MTKKIYSSLKDYFIDKDVDDQQDVFERVKIELLFNLFLIFSIVYLLGFIKIIVDGYWSIFFMRLFGILIIILFFYALKKTKHYTVPAIIWVGCIVFFGLQGLLFNQGSLTFANLGFALLNISLAVLLLNKALKLVFYVYYIIFITYGMSVTYAIIEPLNISSAFFQGQKLSENNLLFTIIPFFLLIYVLYIFVTYEYKVNKQLGKQIDFVRLKEKEINEANKSMFKSIQLASRIQQAFLPKLDDYQSFFQDYFLLLKPKNELSGDFYWVSSNEDSLYLAIIDSAENNITGAIVSSVYYDALDSAVKEKQLTSTSDIICSLNTYIKTKADIKDIKKGIQISMLRIDKKNKKVFFSGEKNSLYFARNGKKVIDEYKAQQFYNDTDCIKYRQVEIDYVEGDMLYMMSDGLSINFKGFSNVKFKESVLKSYIISIKNQPLKIQKSLLENKLTSWIGDDNQTDDVCMIAITL